MGNIARFLTNNRCLVSVLLPYSSIPMKKLITIISSSVALASLCCLSSVVIVALGLSSVSFAASLADSFY